MVAPGPRAELLYQQDVLVWIPDNRYDFFITTDTIRNAAAGLATVEDVLGMPLNYDGGLYKMVASANANTADAIVVGVTDGADQAFTLANGVSTTDKYFILKKGPAFVAQDAVHENDPFGVAYNLTTLFTALRAVEIEVKEPPAVTFEQPI
jgi:hypothetical protein